MVGDIFALPEILLVSCPSAEKFMKQLFLLLLLFSFSTLITTNASLAQNNQWAWMGGSNTVSTNCDSEQGGVFCGQPGVYGTPGKASPNNFPGARFQSMTWTDLQGNLWLFGGYGFDSNGAFGILNDLWEYQQSSKEWIWWSGSSTFTSACISGGQYCEPANYGIIKKPAATNTPGSRWSAHTWTDSSGNLWMFGGAGFITETNIGDLNDLWVFDPGTAEWTWMGGSNTVDAPGVYGTQSKPNINNVPGARDGGSAWTDQSGIFWLFGGEGPDSTGCFGFENDLWSFNPSTLEWTWVAGESTFSPCGSSPLAAPSIAGSYGEFAQSYTPGGRIWGQNWIDSSGNLWLYSGTSAMSSEEGTPDDLWEFETSLQEWGWINGNLTLGPAPGYFWNQLNSGVGNYNTGNTPGSRHLGLAQFGNDGHAWLFSGNSPCDLWAYDPTENQWGWIGGQVTGTCAGVYGSPGMQSAGNIPPGRFAALSWRDLKGNLWIFGGWGWNDPTGSGVFNDFWEYSPLNTITPTLNWNPATPITYPTPLSAAQFDAEAFNGTTNISADGTFVYYVGPVSGGVVATDSTVLPVGNDELCVQWTPTSSGTYNSVSACVYIQVLATPTTTSISSSQNPVFVSNGVTFTANVTAASGTATGTVNFYDSATLLGSVTLSSGQATLTTTSLGVGAHAIVARFVPNSTFAGSTSGFVSEFVDDFTLVNISQSNVIVLPTLSAGIAFMVTPIGPSPTFPANVDISVTGIPPGIPTNLNPPVLPAGTAATIIGLKVDSPITASLHRKQYLRSGLTLALALLLLPFGALIRKSRNQLLRLFLFAAVTFTAVTALSSCSSVLNVSNNTVTVTATSGSLTHSVTFNLQLN
jgi:N-acetylneuraminic acid mutarotase